MPRVVHYGRYNISSASFIGLWFEVGWENASPFPTPLRVVVDPSVFLLAVLNKLIGQPI